MSGNSEEFNSVDEHSDEIESQDETNPRNEVELDEEEPSLSASDKASNFREDPFASLNMPPPIGVDFDSEEEEDSEDLRGPAISALDANKRTPAKKESQLSQKSEDFLASMGIGLDDEESEEVEKPALAPVRNPHLNSQNIFGGFEDDELNTLNDPHTTHLDEPPLLGGRISSTSGTQGLIGRATTPKLFAQAAQFPTCTQLKCFKWENGVPVSIGAIDATADEADFIREFFENMPQKAEGKVRFSFRPIDMNGQELGTEVAFFISDSHKEIIKRRKRMHQEEDSEEDSAEGTFGSLFGNRRRGLGGRLGARRGLGGSNFGDDGAVSQANNMWSRMVNDTRQQTDHLRESLEEERERLRRLEDERAQERVDLAVNTAQGVQALSNQMLEAEQQRAQLSLKQQQQQTETMMNSLSQIFAQQQNMTTLQMQRQQQADQLRVEQERQRAERERLDLEERRRRDREDYEERRNREQREMELKWKEMEEQRRWEREQLRLQLEKEKQEYEQRRIEEQRKWEREMELNRLRIEQEKLENERKIAREREELLLKLKMDREEIERKEVIRREERLREEDRRKEDFLLRQKQMDIQAQRDKEHQERMLQMAVSEREVQREALERKAQIEQEARKAEDSERQRRHEMMMKELEQTRQRDREHSERMFMLQQKEIDVKQMGGLDSLLPKAAGFLTQFGLEPVDVLRSVLGAGEVGDDDDYGDSGGSSSGSWMENLPKILGSVGDIAKLVASGAGGAPMGLPQAQPIPMYAQDPGIQNLMAQQQMVQQQMMAQQQMQQQQQPNLDAFYPPPQQPTQNQPRQTSNGGVTDGEYTLNVPPSEPKPPSTSDLAKAAGMSLSDQRNARKALRKLVKKMRGSDNDRWEDLVTNALIEELGIFSYILAVNAKVAITEAGADDELCTQIINALKTSKKLAETLGALSMSVNDIPFGE